MSRSSSSSPTKRSASASPPPGKRMADAKCKSCGSRSQCEVICEHTWTSGSDWAHLRNGTVLCAHCRECGECGTTERPMVLVTSEDSGDVFVCRECAFYCAACDVCHPLGVRQEDVKFKGAWLCSSVCCVCQSSATNMYGKEERVYCDQCVLQDRTYVDTLGKALDNAKDAEWEEMRMALTAQKLQRAASARKFDNISFH